MKISHSSKTYPERKGVSTTQGIGGPQLDIGAHAVHTIPLAIPSFLVSVTRELQKIQSEQGQKY